MSSESTEVIFLPKESETHQLSFPHDLAKGIALLRRAAEEAQHMGIDNDPVEITLPSRKQVSQG